MSHEFELSKEKAVPATPDQVWEAIATGPGVDSWFMGHSEIGSGEGGLASLTMGGRTESSTIVAWEPGRRLALEVHAAEGAAPMAIEYLIEGRDGSSAVLRLVQTGVMGDDWETEFEAMQTGWDMYLHTLAEYLRYFPGRYATPVTAMRPGVGELAPTWQALATQLGLPDSDAVVPGAGVRLAVPGPSTIEGVVDYADPAGIVGVRSSDALYRFMHTGPERGDVLFLSHHLFGPAEGAERAWQAWLDEFSSLGTNADRTRVG